MERPIFNGTTDFQWNNRFSMERPIFNGTTDFQWNNRFSMEYTRRCVIRNEHSYIHIMMLKKSHMVNWNSACSLFTGVIADVVYWFHTWANSAVNDLLRVSKIRWQKNKLHPWYSSQPGVLSLGHAVKNVKLCFH